MKNVLEFLTDLKANNNRDWFTANKKRFEAANKEFIAFVDELIKGIAVFDPSIAHHQAKDCVFRIYRDVRFSKNKDPYKVNFGAHISAAVKRSDIHSRAGYYIHLEPGASMMGGGAYMPEGDWLKNIREAIDYDPDGFLAILNHKDFKTYFGAMEGEQLKRPPQGYAADHPHVDLLKHKSFLAMHKLADKQVTDAGFLKHALSVCKALKPFDDYLNKAVQ
jgi:uncharacterized protein (TIGR02453 family)